MIVNGYNSKAEAIRALKAEGFHVSGLLSQPESNPKVAKNGKIGVLTAPLHLAPARDSGYEVCPMRSAGCTAACLHTAGNPAYMENKRKSRIAKTRAYMMNRKAFMAVLVFEIAALNRKAEKQGLQTGIRLNATSDIPWEVVAVEVNGHKFNNVMDLFFSVEFYDYTKITKRAIKWAGGSMPPNYHLTFSKHEANDAEVAKVLEAGGNVSVVFGKRAYNAALDAGVWHGLGHFPWKGHHVHNGDDHDFRPADPKGCIVALKAKGDAICDESGFVVR